MALHGMSNERELRKKSAKSSFLCAYSYSMYYYSDGDMDLTLAYGLLPNDGTSCTVSNFPTWFAYKNCHCTFVSLFWSISCLDSIQVGCETTHRFVGVLFPWPTQTQSLRIESYWAVIGNNIYIRKSIAKQAKPMLCNIKDSTFFFFFTLELPHEVIKRDMRIYT